MIHRGEWHGSMAAAKPTQSRPSCKGRPDLWGSADDAKRRAVVHRRRRRPIGIPAAADQPDAKVGSWRGGPGERERERDGRRHASHQKVHGRWRKAWAMGQVAPPGRRRPKMRLLTMCGSWTGITRCGKGVLPQGSPIGKGPWGQDMDRC